MLSPRQTTELSFDHRLVRKAARIDSRIEPNRLLTEKGSPSEAKRGNLDCIISFRNDIAYFKMRLSKLDKWIHMYIYIYICMYVYVYLSIYLYLYLSLSLYTYIYIYIHIHAFCSKQQANDKTRGGPLVAWIRTLTNGLNTECSTV